MIGILEGGHLARLNYVWGISAPRIVRGGHLARPIRQETAALETALERPGSKRAG